MSEPNEITLEGRRPVALVTGGAVRVGRAVCLEFARRGCDILLTHLTRPEAAAEVCAQVAALGGRGTCARLDLSDLAAVEAFAHRVAKLTPRMDVLVHNASLYAPTPLASVTPADLLRNYTVNAAAPLLLTRGLAGRLAESDLAGGGAVVAMGDMHALGRPRRGFCAYAMSKAALGEMVRTLALDLAPKVRVNGVAPGVVAFPDSGFESDPNMQARYLQRVPLNRAGTPEDAANAVRWLALEANYVTGEMVRLDGGRWLA